MTSILDKYGWLSADKVGVTGNLTFFAIIIHSDLATMEKYFPIMQKAVSENAASKSNLAFLQDKIEAAKYHSQTFGTQTEKNSKTLKFSFVPIRDKDHVDERRASVGLPPLKEYAKQWGITNY